MFEIITDSTCDLTPARAEKLGVRVLPMTVHFGEESFRDGLDISNADFYARLREAQDSQQRYAQLALDQLQLEMLFRTGESAISRAGEARLAMLAEVSSVGGRPVAQLADVPDEHRGAGFVCAAALVTADGRAYLDECAQRYEAVLNDAFVGAVPVGSLATVEAARRIRGCLAPGGVYMTNVLASVTGSTGRFLRAEVKTLRSVFRHVCVSPASSGAQPGEVTNWMLAASDAAPDLPGVIEVKTGRDDPVLTDEYLPPAVLAAVTGGI